MNTIISIIDKKLILIFMKLDWLFTLTLITSFIDMFVGIKYNISLSYAIENWKTYFLNPIDYLQGMLLFSFLFSGFFSYDKKNIYSISINVIS